MQKIKNKSGLALTAIVALLSTLVGVAPAQANVETAAVLTPTGAGAITANQMLITEAFDLRLRYGTGVVGAQAADSASGTVGNALIHYVVSSTSGVVIESAGDVGGTYANRVGTSVSATTALDGYVAIPSTSAFVAISIPGMTSMSPAVSVSATPYLELDGQAGMTAGDAIGTAYVIDFVPWSAMGAALTLTQPVANDKGATASWTVTAGNIRWSQLDSSLVTKVYSTRDAGISTSTTVTPANIIAGNYSKSGSVTTATFTTSGAVQSVSAWVLYGSASLSGVTTLAVAAVASDGVSISPVAGANAVLASAGVADARFNSAFTIRAFAHSASATTSINVAKAITVSSIAYMELDADSGVIVNGVTYTNSSTLLAAGFTLAAGSTDFVVSTFGQADDANQTDAITFNVSQGLNSQDLQVTFDAVTLTPSYTPTTVAGLAGASKTFAISVEDQWGVAPVRTDLRVAASVVLSGSTSTTVSTAVAAGAASVTVTPVPAARTGSATVVFTLQQFDQSTQAWIDVATDSATWNIYSYAAGTDAITSRTASISASISYGVALSWSTNVIAVAITNSFSDVVVSAPGLIIQNSDNTTETASDTLTVAANGQAANFKFTSRLAGTYTVTITNGSATTTSQVVVNPARDADGASITFDTATIAAGSTKVITGTLVDANGNPVHTSGSATILVTYVPGGSAGIPIGTMPTETDADGEFSFTVLTGASDAGTAVVTATYYKNGASTAVADVLTFNSSITVGGSAAAPASDQKLTVGSFKGYVAIYALNYTGQKLSARVAGKWLVVEALASRYERVVRNTGAAIPIVVDLYIDGAFVRTENIVTK